MEKNNGKIAIAIVAMFVVALSIVGFTYAYFVASVTNNDADTSVQVTAGELVINYDSTNEIVAKNLVPGWKTDGVSYYDPIYSITQVEIDGVLVNTYSATNTTAHPTKHDGTEPTSDDGITNPATFTVQNTGTDDAAYKVELNVTTNTLNAADSLAHFKYVLKEDGTSVANGTFKGGAETIELIGNRTVLQGATRSYVLELEYVNDEDAAQDSIGASFAAKIVVTGLGQSETTAAQAG